MALRPDMGRDASVQSAWAFSKWPLASKSRKSCSRGCFVALNVVPTLGGSYHSINLAVAKRVSSLGSDPAYWTTAANVILLVTSACSTVRARKSPFHGLAEAK